MMIVGGVPAGVDELTDFEGCGTDAAEPPQAPPHPPENPPAGVSTYRGTPVGVGRHSKSNLIVVHGSRPPQEAVILPSC